MVPLSQWEFPLKGKKKLSARGKFFHLREDSILSREANRKSQKLFPLTNGGKDRGMLIHLNENVSTHV